MSPRTRKIDASETKGLESLSQLVVVDDEASMRALLRDFLQSQGYRVNCFVSGSAALEAIRAGTNPFAVVSHVHMQPMDGLSLLKQVKQDRPTIPVILYTGSVSPAERKEALKLGAVQYLAKPFSLLTLKQLLEEARSHHGK